jgi:chemotaxis signal transduction protein
MTSARAILLHPPGLAHPVAVPPHALSDVLAYAPPMPIPRAQPHCLGVLDWQGRMAFALDLASALGRSASLPRFWAVLRTPAAVQHLAQQVAVGLADRPVEIEVTDETACALPEPVAVWSLFAVSCFQHAGQAVPIVSAERLLQAALAAA